MRKKIAWRKWMRAVAMAAIFGASSMASESPNLSERTKVESSSIASVGYTRSAAALEIEFRSGAIYRYRDIPMLVFQNFMRAESKGRFFTAQIRGKYPYERLRKHRE